MSMKFTVTLTGTVIFDDIEVSTVIDADEVIANEAGYTDVEFSGAEVESATVSVRADARLSGHEVSPADMEDFDAGTTLSDAIGSFSVTVEDANYEIDESPTGFDEVSAALGYDSEQAMAVYAAIDRAGYEVI